MRLRTLLALIGAVALLTPTFASAAIPFFGPIIPAAQASCPAGWALVMIVINNIISLLITLLIVFVAPLTIAWAGFLYVINPVDPSGKSKAKSILIHTVVGLVVALMGWLIVDFIMAVLYNKDAPELAGKTWSSLVTGGGDTCLKVAEDFNPATPPTGSPTTPTAPGVTPASGFDPIVAARSLAISVFATKSGGACAYSIRTNALIPGGLSSFATAGGYPKDAADYGSYLTKAGFQTVSSSGYKPMIGDIVVFDRTSAHPFGHIEMYTDNGWISDFVQKTMYPWTGGSYTIYRWPQAQAGPGDGGGDGGVSYTPTEPTNYELAALHNSNVSFPRFEPVMGKTYAFRIPTESGFISNTMATGLPGQQMPTTVEWGISPYPGDFGYGKTEESSVTIKFGTVSIKEYPCSAIDGIESGGVHWTSSSRISTTQAACIVPSDGSWYINFRVTAGCDDGVVCPLLYAWIPQP